MFRPADSVTLVGTELTTVLDALDHSVKVLSEQPDRTAAEVSAIARRTAIANRLRRMIARAA